jgi:hypothetical protein
LEKRRDGETMRNGESSEFGVDGGEWIPIADSVGVG